MITTAGRHGPAFKESMKLTNDDERDAMKMTQLAASAAVQKLVAAYLAIRNLPLDQLQVTFVTGSSFATHLNFQIIGTGFQPFLIWATARGANIYVTIAAPGEEDVTVQQRLYSVTESEGRRTNSPMAVRRTLDAKNPPGRFTVEVVGIFKDASSAHEVMTKAIQDALPEYHTVVRIGQDWRGLPKILITFDEAVQGDNRYNRTIDMKTMTDLGRATTGFGHLILYGPDGSMKYWPMIDSRRLEHSRRQARETIAGERHANSGVGVAPVITRAAPDQEEAAQATTSQTAAARQAAALATAERAAADQEEAAAGRAAADQEEAAQATAVLAAAGRAADQEEAAQAATRQTAAPAAAMQAAADQKEGPFTMVPTKQKRERATATTPGNSPPRARKSSTTAQQRMGKFWGENSDEGTDEETLMRVSDDEENGDIVGKIATTATGAGKRATWVAKPLQALRITEEQKWRVTNGEQLDAIVEMYVRELGDAERIRDFFLHNGTPTDKVAIYQPLYLAAVKRFRHSRQFKDQMQLINCPMQISILDFGPLFGGDDPAAAIALTFRSIAAAVAAHELLMELHHKNEWPPFAVEFVGQDL
jgi:hypothetical protein